MIRNSMDIPADITRFCVPGTNTLKILHEFSQEVRNFHNLISLSIV
jgi:hypothetical protein